MLKASRTFDPIQDDRNWQILFETHFQQMQALNAISTLWISGLSKLGIDHRKRPTAEFLTEAVRPYTGYTFVQTQQNIILEQIDWYRMIAAYQMPLTNFVRTPEELHYCDEPDIWHDIMGHIPFLVEKEYSDMYRLLASTYVLAYTDHNQAALQQLDFIGGHLIELGLIREPSGIKAFGATFYSSTEVVEAFKSENQILLSPEAMAQAERYDRSGFQGKYFVFESIEQLVGLIWDIRKMTGLQD